MILLIVVLWGCLSAIATVLANEVYEGMEDIKKAGVEL